MKARALKKLFSAGRLQSPGDVFEVSELNFNPKMMEKVSGDEKLTAPIKPREGRDALPESGTIGPDTRTGTFIDSAAKVFTPSVAQKAPRKTARKTRARKKA